jgi:hypothetical protein
MTTITEIMSNPEIKDRLDALAQKIKETAEEGYNGSFLTALREISSYNGDVRIVANVDYTIDAQNRIGTNIALGLEFPAGYVDVFEEMQRIIFRKFFRIAIENYSSE